jgi:hypothetical protein
MLLNVEEFQTYRNEDDDKESIHWKIVKFGSYYKLYYILPNDCNSPTEEIKTNCQY